MSVGFIVAEDIIQADRIRILSAPFADEKEQRAALVSNKLASEALRKSYEDLELM